MSKAAEPPDTELLDAKSAHRLLVERISSASARGPATRDYVHWARRHAETAHRNGASGIEFVEHWTGLVDQLVTALYASVARESGLEHGATALFALGGYGRGELSPHSDLDLLVLHPGADEITPLAEGLLYPLWDAGVEVQCVARTVDENVEVARADFRSRTSLLEARFLTGDRSAEGLYAAEILDREIFGHDVRVFAEAKIAEMEARHRRYGDTVYVLEPNVKEGEGGLRDIQTALWIAMARFKVRSVAGLLHKGALPPAEIEALKRSREFLLRVRNHLHFLAGRRDDRLTFEYQEDAAPFFGFFDQGEIPGVERFLQAFYATANRARHFSATVLRRATAGLLPRPASARRRPREIMPGIRLLAEEIHLKPEVVRRRPLTLLAAFEVAQNQDAELSPQALEVVREHLDLVDDRFRRDPEAVAMFLRVLSHPRRVATTLVRMHDVRLLGRFIPEFESISGRVQRDLYHAYPVDVHSLFTVQELRRLARGEYEEELPLLTSLMRELERPDILYLAALLHDIGKGEGHGHDERGAEMALAVGDRMGLDPRDLEYLVFLVRNHLLLSHTAQGRDLHDEELLASFARKIRDVQVLKMLYLLTAADIRAVGPGAWTSWKHLLLRELYEKARSVLETGAFPRGLAVERAREVGEKVRRVAADQLPPEDVEVFLADFDDPQYLLANPIEAILRHLDAFSRRDRDTVVDLRPVPAESYTEVVLVTRDRPGLFAQVAGLMAAHRLNILSAALNTRRDGWVLDVFHVSAPPGEALATGTRWEQWQGDLLGVFHGEVSFEAAVGSRLREHTGLWRPRPKVATRIEFDNQASRRCTVIDVKAADRLGLLYDVTRTLADRNLTIRLAKIVTNIDQVADSFYVEVVGGGKLTDPGELGRLQADLEEVIPGTRIPEEGA